MTAVLDPQFAAALRRELVVRVRPPAARPWWRRRPVLTLVGAAVAVGLAGGGAVAANRQTAPGAWEVEPLAAPVTATLDGTGTVDLGPRPEGAGAVDMLITCLAGSGDVWIVPGVESVECPGPESGGRNELAPGQTAWTFTADPGVRYRVTLTYLLAEQTEWGVNADGYTYGAEKAPLGGGGPRTDANVPDLTAVIASNGRSGYAWSRDLDGGPEPTSPQEAAHWSETHPCQARSVPVYESDGKTQIGVFEMSC